MISMLKSIKLHRSSAIHVVQELYGHIQCIINYAKTISHLPLFIKSCSFRKVVVRRSTEILSTGVGVLPQLGTRLWAGLLSPDDGGWEGVGRDTREASSSISAF